jgi:hypothetical protein
VITAELGRAWRPCPCHFEADLRAVAGYDPVGRVSSHGVQPLGAERASRVPLRRRRCRHDARALSRRAGATTSTLLTATTGEEASHSHAPRHPGSRSYSSLESQLRCQRSFRPKA